MKTDTICNSFDKSCKTCKNLMFSDFYGECAFAYKGIVQPWDICEHYIAKDSDVHA